MFSQRPGWQVASAGTDRRAETPLSRDLLEWAGVAVCMEKAHRETIRRKFRGALPDDRLLILGVPDDYEYMNAELVRLRERTVPQRLAGQRPR